ncbi:MAG: hypothetical protein V4615_03560 [Bacteroidota bacterium]
MNSRLIRSILATSMVMLFSVSQISAQSKDETKAREALAKAMTQTDPAKRSEGISKAKEGFMKAGMKPQEVSAIVGEAYLEKGDLVNATNSYNASTKELKKEGLKKVAEAYVEQGFNEDDKAQAKSLNKAMSLFGKSDAAKEGARMIGDRFYEKGISAYPKAIEYYVVGDGAVKIEQIAKEYFEKGGENEIKAAETYLKLKNADGAKKAGDIYYNRNEFGKAIEAYLSGGVEEGIQKYADYLYAEHRNEEADNLIMRLGDAYSEQKNDEAVEKLAARTMNKGSYLLASKLYDKAGNVTMGDKCRAYDALIEFRLDEAKGLFSASSDLASLKMVTDNEKALTPLQYLAENMEDLMKNAPFVNLITDSVTGKSVPSSDDQKMREEYYKSIREQIIKNVNDIAVNYAKLSDVNLKKYVRQRFLRYGAVRSILDTETFAVKKLKADIKIKDLVL